MERSRAWMPALVAGWLLASLGAAPATPTYVNVEAVMARVQQAWAAPGGQADPNAPGVERPVRRHPQGPRRLHGGQDRR